ncbi:hypothetical protein BI364_16445 [Acidihalobacter yilgarnensis]|uniref:Uncharacterized protein n=1 Tax=Acidihalobacter yilgarnensis TaxID=2819280 RepID=A0A1D8ISC7_9GAMM|nr:hypothetical protein BI364_16445 [Acidihalobacter yilgarnensis]
MKIIRSGLFWPALPRMDAMTSVNFGFQAHQCPMQVVADVIGFGIDGQHDQRYATPDDLLPGHRNSRGIFFGTQNRRRRFLRERVNREMFCGEGRGFKNDYGHKHFQKNF